MLVSENGSAIMGDGVRLFVRVAGQGDEALIVPGVGAELDFERLGNRRRVAFYDIRNRGRSDPVDKPGRVGLPVEVDDVDAVRAHVGFARTSVLGWSYVGLVVALYAARHARFVDRLVMVCPAAPCQALLPGAEAPPAEVIERLSDLETRRASVDPAAYAREWRRIVTPTRMADPAAFDRLRSDPSRWPNEWPDHVTDALQRVHATHPAGFDYRPSAGKIAAPTLIIHGGADRAVPRRASEAWTRAIPDARLLVLPDVGHFPHVEAPSAFFSQVETFLNGHWPVDALPLSA